MRWFKFAPMLVVAFVLALVAGCAPSGVDDPITGPEPPTGPGKLSAYSNHDPATVKVLSVIDGRIAIVGTLNTPFAEEVLPIGSYGLVCERDGFTPDRTKTVTIEAGKTALVVFNLEPTDVPPPPPLQATAAITADKTEVSPGQAVKLTATAGNGIWAEVSPYGTVLPNGTQEVTVYPAVTTTYALNVLGRGDNNFAHAEVTVEVFNTPTPPPTGELTVDPEMVNEGQSTSISVKAANHTGWEVFGSGIIQAGTEGNFNFRDTPTHSGWITLRVTGTGGQVFVTRVFVAVVPQGTTKPTLTVAIVPDSASVTIFKQSGNGWSILTSFTGFKTVVVDPGIYRVTAERFGWRMATDFVLVEPGENELLVLHLDRPGDPLPPPHLLVESEPSGTQADVFRLNRAGQWDLYTSVTTPARLDVFGDFKLVYNRTGYHTGYDVASVPEHGSDVAFAELVPLGAPPPLPPTVTVTVSGPLSNRVVEYGRHGQQAFTCEVHASENSRLVLLFIKGELVRAWNSGGVYTYVWTPPDAPRRDGNPTIDGEISNVVAIAVGPGGESSDYINVLTVYARVINYLGARTVAPNEVAPWIESADLSVDEGSGGHVWTAEQRTSVAGEGVAVVAEIDGHRFPFSRDDQCPATPDLVGTDDKILWFDAGTVSISQKVNLQVLHPDCQHDAATTHVHAGVLAVTIR